jgi:hypothetical protein
MTVINHYRLRCITENADVETWAESAPATCPNNNGHSIDPASVVLVESINSETAYIQDVDPGEKYAQYQACGHEIAANVEGDWAYSTLTFPFPIRLYAAWPLGIKLGDHCEVTIAPDTVIGVLASAVSSGATQIMLGAGQGVNTKTGQGFKIGAQDCGRIKAVDGDAVTFEIALGSDASAGTPCKITTYLLRGYSQRADWCPDIGNSKVGGARIPANTPIRFGVKNNQVPFLAYTASALLEYMILQGGITG